MTTAALGARTGRAPSPTIHIPGRTVIRMTKTKSIVAAVDDIVTDPVLGIRRKIVAGQNVPPDLVEPYLAAHGEPDDAVDYENDTVDELRAEADRRGLQVEGTGSGGSVVKADLVAALNASDA